MRIAMIAALLLVSVSVGLPAVHPVAGLAQGVMPTGSALEKQFAFRSAMRKLWEDHITWTRLYIVSVAADLSDKDATAQRLLQNQTDIGNAIKPFYGNAAGDKLTALLRTHILTAADLLAAAKGGDTAKMGDASKRWYANADEIAAFLSGANPKRWALAEMKAMMRRHLDLTLEEASARLKGDWAADIAAYNKVHDQILRMADMLSQGMIRQFPAKFR
ncbi:MAG: glycosyltransferase [Armatimonadota bacterium]